MGTSPCTKYHEDIAQILGLPTEIEYGVWHTSRQPKTPHDNLLKADFRFESRWPNQLLLVKNLFTINKVV